jgi:hypothetical protein
MNMLVTALTLVAFYVIAVGLAAVAFAAKNEALLGFSALFFLFGGYLVLSQGIPEQIGENVNMTNTTTTTVYIYDANIGPLSYGLGVASFLFGGALFFYILSLRKSEREHFERGEL